MRDVNHRADVARGPIAAVVNVAVAAVSVGKGLIQGGMYLAEKVGPRLFEHGDEIVNGARRLLDHGNVPVAEPTATAGILPTAPASSFLGTESLAGNASSRLVRWLTDSMETNGWRGDPIEVAQNGDDLFIINGHHRVAAAMRAGIDVPYRVLTDEEWQGYGYNSMQDIINAWASAGPNRLR
jgi:hypothetical protein